MYFRAQKQANVLLVDDDFARLSRITDDGSLEFEFTYSLSQCKAVQNRATKVTVTVESRSVSPKHVSGQTQRGYIDTRAIVNGLRTSITHAKTAAEQQMRHVVARRESDITSMINNEILPQLRAKVPPAKIQHLTRPRLTMVSAGSVRQDNDPRPLLQRVAHSRTVIDLQSTLTSSFTVDPQSLMHDMIVRQGLDPSHITNLADRASSEHTTRGGLTTPSGAEERETDPSTRLLNYILFPPTLESVPTTTDDVVDTDMVRVISPVTNDVIGLVVPITVHSSKRRVEGAPVTQLYVTFELIDSHTGLAVDSVAKVLDVAKHLRIFNTPKLPPKVGFAPSSTSGRVNLEIKQVDPGATEVHVYKKSFWVSSPNVDGYTLVGMYPLSCKDQTLLVQVDLPHSAPVLYRIIPVGQQSIHGFEYTNVTVRPARYRPVSSASLVAQQVDTGVRLELRKLPTSVVAVQFMRWNLTTHEKVPVVVGSDVGIIDPASRQADMIATVDSTVSPGNVYQYRARLVYRTGLTIDCGDSVVDFLQPAPGQVDTRIDNVVVSHDVSPNVSFTITTKTVDGDVDAVRQMLSRQGLTDYFNDDVLNQRDQLEKLVAHNVQRVDLLTGHREDFGVLTTAEFDDDSLRKGQAVRPLEYGHRYRYEIYPLLRAPETLFDGFVKTTTDSVTKKPYSYKPAKFKHPFTLSRGVLVSMSGARMRYAKDPMSYGVVGAMASMEVSFDNDAAKVVDQAVSRFDRKTNVVTWNVIGGIESVDHFIILKQAHGIRTLLGKSHSAFANGNCQYMHVTSAKDVGAIQYVIVPVHSDYKVGAEAVTNTIVMRGT